MSRFLPTTGVYRDLQFQKQESFFFNPYHHTLNTEEVSPSVQFYQVTGMSFDDRVPDAYLPTTRTPITKVLLETPSTFEAAEYPATTLNVPVNDEEREYLRKTVNMIWSKLPDRDPVRFAYAASRWLGLEHIYSTSLSRHTGKGDPVIRWMQSGEGGHCEYFSAALVLLCREAGVPARVVTGFHGGSWNGFENYFMVKNADAHAWVEVFDGERYWRRVDPTPGGNLGVIDINEATETATSFVDSSVTAYLDSLRILWYRRVVNFDNKDQLELVEGVSSSYKEFIAYAKELISDAVEGFKSLASDPFQKEKLTLFGTAFVTFMAVYLIVRVLLSRVRAHAYFKFFGTRKRKHIQQLKERVQAGRLLDRFRHRMSESNMSADSIGILDDLLKIRFGAVDSWPSIQLTMKRAKKLIKNL